ncbi:class I SAM-dependent methyltransferase [Synechococcus sp. AH-603-M21]|nr:class I SAM-dependent methyltransferase [Synechococcus sp. AH-603-M21]
MSRKLLVCVTNYAFSENAILLKKFFGAKFETILIDSSTPGGCPEADIVIPNTYYPGLWNEAVGQAIQRNSEWLLFVASDVELVNAEMMHDCILEALDDSSIQLWSPSITDNSRASFKSTVNRPTAGMRLGGVVEGFCFMARRSLLCSFHPVPKENIFGWHIDVVTAMRAHEIGKVAVDDRIMIYHPPKKAKHQIDSSKAFDLGDKHLKSFGFSKKTRITVKDIEDHGSKNLPTPALKVQRSLDLGCGCKPKDPFGTGNAFGIDVRNPDNRPEIITSDLYVHPIPYETSSFDYITAFDFIEHVPRLVYLGKKRHFCFVELMNEIYRVLKPGGVFASLTPVFPHPEAFQNPNNVNMVTNQTFPLYFCKPHQLAAMYGFKGIFTIINQSSKNGGKLLTLMRAIKHKGAT